MGESISTPRYQTDRACNIRRVRFRSVLVCNGDTGDLVLPNESKLARKARRTRGVRVALNFALLRAVMMVRNLNGARFESVGSQTVEFEIRKFWKINFR